MNVLIIEDEKLAADRLEKLILAYDSQIKILSRLDSVQSAISWFENNQTPDLTFMDIELSDGYSFDIFEKVNFNGSIIFTTAYTEYAIKAFKVNSIDYLLKPIGQKELTQAIDKFKNLNPNLKTSESIKSTQSIIFREYKKRFMVKIGDRFQSIPIEDVLYFHSKEKVSFIRTKDQKNYILDTSLDQIEEGLSPIEFFRLNRQYIITYDSVRDVVAYSNSRLKIQLHNCEDNEILISREKVNTFKNWLDL